MEAGIRLLKVEDEIAGVLKGQPMTFDEADSGNVNPHYIPHSATSENCSCCVLSLKARMDGFNVQAKPDDKLNSIMYTLSEHTNMGFIDKNTGLFPDYIKPKERYMPRLLLWFENHLENDKLYSIEFYWKDFTPDGHIMNILKYNGELMLYDPQTDQKYARKEIEKLLYTTRLGTIKLLNLSDCFLNKAVVDYVLEAKV